MALAEVFARTGRHRRPALIPYLMAGDPDVQTTRALLERLRQAGASAVELGIPYGDPLADGPTIQAAGQRALGAGVDMEGVFALADRNSEIVGVPLILFTYYNPVMQYGMERFAARAKRAGVDGVIIPDVPYEEIDDQLAVLTANGIDIPLLVSPTTPPERAEAIAKRASGFVYIVSRLGVTGAGSAPDASALIRQIDQLREVTDLPLVVGFGISTAAHVESIAPHVNGIIVGSALIDAYAGKRGPEAAEAAVTYLRSLFPEPTPTPR